MTACVRMVESDEVEGAYRRVVTVIYTARHGMIRVVSAWDADERDARRYDR